MSGVGAVDLGDDFTDPCREGVVADGTADETATFTPVYESMHDWAQRWLTTILARKLTGSAGKGKVWCPQWWAHPEVAVRLDALWRGWEGAKASDDPSAMSGWWVYHTDAHLRVLLDADNGPMYLCSKSSHTATPSLRRLLIAPPLGWFDDAGAVNTEYESMHDWVDSWLAPTLARKLTGSAGKGKVWCPQWWAHPEVAVRLDALWRGWEGAKASDDPSAMSGWWVYHTDAHLRVLLDADNSPMYRCGKDKHAVDTPPLSGLQEPPPKNWFTVRD